MEVIGYIAAIAAIGYLIYLLCIYVIFPVASILSGIALVVSLGYALFVSLSSFITSFKNNIDPYSTYVDKHSDISGGVRRNYCFGPGFHQISEIVKGAFSNLGGYRIKLTAWKNKMLSKSIGWFVDIWIYIIYGLAVFCALVLGCAWVSVFSIVLGTAIIIGLISFFTFFSVLWLTDRAVLLIKSIHNRCPNCKRKSVIPVFVCPTCGMEHKKLVPGPYGVVKRKCLCGTMLSTTFIRGRSEYEARCPFCDTELFSSGSQQYGIQLVGGVGTGKTTFLAAFWNEYKEWLNERKDISYQQIPADAFSELENWFNSGKAEATLETNASMYSIIHTTADGTSVQMTIYDIAGEAFDFVQSGTQQQQFRYCEGFIIVVDPTATPDYISDTITNFINSMDEISGKHVSKSASIPVAIIISKADLYKRSIGLPRIKSSFNSCNSEYDKKGYEQHQDSICRDFLLSHGYENTINLLESKFSNIRFFPVSAMGHNIEVGQYEPWGVLEPVFWIMSSENCPLRAIVQH